MQPVLLEIPGDAMRGVLAFLPASGRHALRATCRRAYGVCPAADSSLRVPATNAAALLLCRGRAKAELLPFWGRHARRVVLELDCTNPDERTARGFCWSLAQIRASQPPLVVEIRPVGVALSLANWLANADGLWARAEIELTGTCRFMSLFEFTPRLAERLAWCDYVFGQARGDPSAFITFPVLRNLYLSDWVRALPAGRSIRELFPSVRHVAATPESSCIRAAVQKLSAGLESVSFEAIGIGRDELEPIELGPQTAVRQDFAVFPTFTGGRLVESAISEPAVDTGYLYVAERVLLSVNRSFGAEAVADRIQQLPNCVELSLRSGHALPCCRTKPKLALLPAQTHPNAGPAERDAEMDAPFAEALRKAPKLQRLFVDACTVDVCRLGPSFPDTLRLVDLARFSSGASCEVPFSAALGQLAHLIAGLSAHSSHRVPCRIVAPGCTDHAGGRAYSQAIADLRMAAKPDGDAPEVWLPADVPWEFCGLADAGPPQGVRISSVLLTGAWFNQQAGSGPEWANDVERLVLRPPLGAAIRVAASQLAGLFCNATEIAIPVPLTRADDISTAREMICATGSRLRRITSPAGNKFSKCAAIRSACPWAKHVASPEPERP